MTQHFKGPEIEGKSSLKSKFKPQSICPSAAPPVTKSGELSSPRLPPPLLLYHQSFCSPLALVLFPFPLAVTTGHCMESVELNTVSIYWVPAEPQAWFGVLWGLISLHTSNSSKRQVRVTFPGQESKARTGQITSQTHTTSKRQRQESPKFFKYKFEHTFLFQVLFLKWFPDAVRIKTQNLRHDLQRLTQWFLCPDNQT